MRRAFGALIAAILAAAFLPALASPAAASTVTFYAVVRDLEFAGDSFCRSIPDNPGSAAANGAPDGIAWTIDTSLTDCDSHDEIYFAPTFTGARCTDTSGITAFEVALTTTGGQDTVEATDTGLAWIVNGGGFNPGVVGDIPDDGSTITWDLTADVADLLGPGVLFLMWESVRDGTHVYNIDAVTMTLTGDLTSCGILDFEFGTEPVIGDFPGVTLNGSPQLVTLLVPPFAINDSTETGAGWHLTLTIDDLVNGAATIPASTMTMEAPMVSPMFVDDPNGVEGHAPTGDLAAGEKIVTADVDSGKGTYTVYTLPVKFIVPTEAIAGTYTTTASVTLVSGP